MANTASKLVDYHCHLDLYPDVREVFEESSAFDVITLAVTTTPKAWAKDKELAQSHENIRVALGFHPQLIGERIAELPLFERLLPEARFIGEVGLDAGPRFYGSYAEQKAVFERVLKGCAEAGGKILSVHSVRSARDVLNLIERFLPLDRGRVVLHWFSGAKADLDRAVELGCYFSINHQMLIKEVRRRLIVSFPIDRILTETDGPFTAVSDRPSRPKDVVTLIPPLAKLLAVSEEQMGRQILTNVKTLETGYPPPLTQHSFNLPD